MIKRNKIKNYQIFIEPKIGKELKCQWSIHEHVKLKCLHNDSAVQLWPYNKWIITDFILIDMTISFTNLWQHLALWFYFKWLIHYLTSYFEDICQSKLELIIDFSASKYLELTVLKCKIISEMAIFYKLYIHIKVICCISIDTIL